MPAIIPKPLRLAALPLAVLGAVAVGGCGALEQPLPSLAILYGRENETAACEDAFTLVQNEDTGAWSVADYFCR